MRPTCVRHFVKMVAYCSRDIVTYYRCPVDSCDHRTQIVRNVDKVTPIEPTYCLACDEAMEFLRKNEDNSVTMICPECGAVVKLQLQKI